MIGIVIGIVLLTFSGAVAAWRMFVGPGDANRAISSDLFFFVVIGLISLVGVLFGIRHVFDLVLVATVLGLLATVSMARVITRGAR